MAMELAPVLELGPVQSAIQAFQTYIQTKPQISCHCTRVGPNVGPGPNVRPSIGFGEPPFHTPFQTETGHWFLLASHTESCIMHQKRAMEYIAAYLTARLRELGR